MLFDDHTYEELLQKQRWKRKREIILNRDSHKCVICQSNDNLNVHHKYYEIGKLPWEYTSDSLYTLCQHCHHLFHEAFKPLVYTRDENDRLLRMELTPCYRCNGVGRLPEYSHVKHGVCFRCNGERFEELIEADSKDELSKFIIDKFVFDVASYYLTNQELNNMLTQTTKNYHYDIEKIQVKDLVNLKFLARHNNCKAQLILGEYYYSISDYENSIQWFSYAILNGSPRALCKVYDLIVQGDLEMELESRREWKQLVERVVDSLIDRHMEKMGWGNLKKYNHVLFRTYAPYSKRCKQLYMQVLKEQNR